MTERVEMIVRMQVTPAQGLALEAMFRHWNKLASQGSSRNVGFFVDGDGNFKPDVKMGFPKGFPKLTEELEAKAIATEHNVDVTFDFDSIAWAINHPA